MKSDNTFRNISVSLISIWLGIFALLAFLLVVLLSFMKNDSTTIFSWQFTLDNYAALFSSLYALVFAKSFYIAGACTFFCILLGYPFAYILARKVERWKEPLLLFLIIPFWTSSLIRSYAMVAILKTKGVLNNVLMHLGIIHHPLQLLFTNSAVMIALVYNLLPFMILPLYANLEKFDNRLIEAARDLGAGKIKTFTKIILPLSLPGIVAGSILVFLPAMTLFYIPDLLGGAKALLLGNLIENQFLLTNNWPLGSAISVTLTLIMGVMLIAHWLTSKNRERGDFL
ncbi:MAG: spermidine/putrescine ABC transporter permease PotB [Legionellales bacterium]|nr:spermidine/putrescine ABC transporter permease PotB [Legionellales bacterium]